RLAVALHAEDERPVGADLPVRRALLPAVGHQERVVAVGQGVHAHPGDERERVERPRDVEADAVADALELEAALARPPPRPPRAPAQGAVGRLAPGAGLVEEGAAPDFPRLEGVVDQQAWVVAQRLGGRLPGALALLRGLARPPRQRLRRLERRRVRTQRL